VGGPTEATNLQLLAQLEHLLKQAGEHARPGHGWSVAVDRTSPPPDDGSPPEPSPGDGVVWTSPTGHTYRVSPHQLLEPAGASTADSVGGTSVGGTRDGGAAGGSSWWVHHLLADVLPTWVGWPGAGSTDQAGEPPRWPVGWARDWATAALTDDPPVDGDRTRGDDSDEPCLFDDLPAA